MNGEADSLEKKGDYQVGILYRKFSYIVIFHFSLSVYPHDGSFVHFYFFKISLSLSLSSGNFFVFICSYGKKKLTD